MRRLQLFRCAFVLILAGCSINRAGLANDIQALLDRCNVKPKTTNVIMANRSRTGIVEISATAEDVIAITNGVGLREADLSAADPDLSAWLSDGASQFDHPLLHPQEGIKIFRSTRRPKTLTLPNGSSFEYMLLFWDKAKGVALIQLSYAYG